MERTERNKRNKGMKEKKMNSGNGMTDGIEIKKKIGRTDKTKK